MLARLTTNDNKEKHKTVPTDLYSEAVSHLSIAPIFIPYLRIMSTMVGKSVPEIFTSASLSIIPTDSKNSNSAKIPTSAIIREIGDGGGDGDSNGGEAAKEMYSTCAYFRDANSKKAKTVIPILISFHNEFERKKILKSGAIQPAPSDHESEDDSDGYPSNDTAVKIESDTKERSDEVVQNNDDDDESWDAELDLIGETHQEDNLERYGKNEIKFECTYKHLDDDEKVDLDEGVDNKADTVIEAIKILSTSLVDNVSEETSGIRFELELTVCLQSLAEESVLSSIASQSQHKSINTAGSNHSNKLEIDLKKRAEAEIFRTNLEIRAFLLSSNAEASYSSYSRNENSNTNTNGNVNDDETVDEMQIALQALNMGLESRIFQEENTSLSYFSKLSTYYLPPKTDPAPLLKLNILPALLVSVRGISAPASKTGVTLISLVLYHSNVHNENVTITNIALHPGHSRLLDQEYPNTITKDFGQAMPAGERTVMDMTKSVRWGYASGTSPSLPLVLKPQEAIATVLQINANEVMDDNSSRSFVSPIGVRAAVGDISRIDSNVSDIYRNRRGVSASVVMVTEDATWTTSPIVAMGSTDAFKVSLSVRESVCTVGAQVTVDLKVLNLSTELRDLMLIMAKDDDVGTDADADGNNNDNDNTNSPNNADPNMQPDLKYANNSQNRDDLNGMSLRGKKSKSASTLGATSTLGMSGVSGNDNETHSQHKSATKQTHAHAHAPKNTINNAIVSEVNGYTFGCWGLSDKDDGTVRHSRDHDLLAVDAALLLGEVKGQHAIEAELRFVPFTEGTLSVPNLKLYDKNNERWYDCDHTLKIISVAKQ